MKKSKYAGKEVTIKCKKDPDELNGKKMIVEDYWINLGQGSWMMGTGNPACLKYAVRSGFACLPSDDNVLYGKVDGFGHLIHESEIA